MVLFSFLLQRGASLSAVNCDGDVPVDIALDETTESLLQEYTRRQGKRWSWQQVLIDWSHEWSKPHLLIRLLVVLFPFLLPLPPCVTSVYLFAGSVSGLLKCTYPALGQLFLPKNNHVKAQWWYWHHPYRLCLTSMHPLLYLEPKYAYLLLFKSTLILIYYVWSILNNSGIIFRLEGRRFNKESK